MFSCVPTCYRTHSTANFPSFADAIAKLKATDHHFANLLGQHDAVDTEITKSETGLLPLISDDALETPQETAAASERPALRDREPGVIGAAESDRHRPLQRQRRGRQIKTGQCARFLFGRHRVGAGNQRLTNCDADAPPCRHRTGPAPVQSAAASSRSPSVPSAASARNTTWRSRCQPLAGRRSNRWSHWCH